MAIAQVGNKGSGTATNAGSTTTFSPASTMNAGDLVVLILTLGGLSRTLSSVTDNSGGGNTWNIDQQVGNGTSATVAIVSSVLAGNVTSSNTITATWSAILTGSATRYTLEEFSGTSSTPFDVAATATGSGTALTSGTTGSAAAGDLGIAAWGIGSNSTFTAGSGYTALTVVTAANISELSEFQLNVSGAQSATGTAGTTGTWAGAQATYKVAPAAVVAGLAPNKVKFIYQRRNR